MYLLLIKFSGVYFQHFQGLDYEQIDFEDIIIKSEKSMRKVNMGKIMDKYKKHFNPE